MQRITFVWIMLLLATASPLFGQAPTAKDAAGATGAADPISNLPLLKVETLAAPVVTSRCWTSALVPNPRGGWNWVGQYFNYKGTWERETVTIQLPTGQHYANFKDTESRPDGEWIIMDLQTGKYRIQELPAWGASNPCLAGNGRVFFSADYAHIYYYDPVDESMKILGRVHDDRNVLRGFYKFQVGPDGMIYGSAQASNGMTCVIRLNPDTLEYKLITEVGTPDRRTLTYGYYLGIQPPWVYVAVGQGKWELWAVNMDSGEKKKLAERVEGETSRVVVGDDGKGNCSAQLHGQPGAETLALNDGQIVARAKAGEKLDYTPTPKSWPAMTWTKSKPVTAAIAKPQIDVERSAQIEGDGSASIYWRPDGDKSDWRIAKFAIKRAEPEIIESLTLLPDGSILGSVRQYNGWFQYYPDTGKYKYYGKGGPSRAKTVLHDGKVYFSGYPNATLYVFDPAKPWQEGLTNKPDANPRQIGSQGQTRSEAHYSMKMDAAPGRVYTLGKRERWSTGTGLCCYLPEKNDFIFLGQENKDLHPVDFLVMSKLGRVVVSGSKPDAQLLVYDLDFKDLGRIDLRKGLENTGELQAVSDSLFLGWYEDPDLKKTILYLYDLANNKMVKKTELEPGSGPVSKRPVDSTFWIFTSQGICRLDPATLNLTPVAKLQRDMSGLVWRGKELYGRTGGEVVKISQPLP